MPPSCKSFSRLLLKHPNSYGGVLRPQVLIISLLLKDVGLERLAQTFTRLPVTSVLAFFITLLGGRLSLDSKPSDPAHPSMSEITMLCHVVHLHNACNRPCYDHLLAELRKALYSLKRSEIDFAYLLEMIWVECERDVVILNLVGPLLVAPQPSGSIQPLMIDHHFSRIPQDARDSEFIQFIDSVSRRYFLPDQLNTSSTHFQKDLDKFAPELDDLSLNSPPSAYGSFVLGSSFKGKLNVMAEVLYARWPPFKRYMTLAQPNKESPEVKEWKLPLTFRALLQVYTSILTDGRADIGYLTVTDALSVLKSGDENGICVGAEQVSLGLFKSLAQLDASESSGMRGITPTFGRLIDRCFDIAFPSDDLFRNLESASELEWSEKKAEILREIRTKSPRQWTRAQKLKTLCGSKELQLEILRSLLRLDDNDPQENDEEMKIPEDGDSDADSMASMSSTRSVGLLHQPGADPAPKQPPLHRKCLSQQSRYLA